LSFDPNKMLGGDASKAAEDMALKDVLRHSYSMSKTKTITPDGIMNIDAPSHLIDYMDGHTGFGFSSDALSNPEYDQGGTQGLVIWLKRDFWNPNQGAFEKRLPELRQDTDAMVRILGDRYDANLACYLFSDGNMEKSNTPVALVITGDMAAQEKLHGEIMRDLATMTRVARNEGRSSGGGIV